MADFKQALIERNRVAHTEVLRSEYENMVAALTSISNKNSLAQKENESLLVQQQVIKEENARIQQNSEDLNKQINEKIKALESKEQEITSLCNDKEAACKSIEQDSRDKVLTLKSKIEGQYQTLLETNTRVSLNVELLNLQEQEILSNKLTLEDIHAKILESKGELRAINLSRSKELTNLDKQIKDKSTELETVSRIIQEERGKISKPMELLTLEATELKQIKQDLDIAQSQIAQRWEKVFPTSKYIYVNLLRSQ